MKIRCIHLACKKIAALLFSFQGGPGYSHSSYSGNQVNILVAAPAWEKSKHLY